MKSYIFIIIFLFLRCTSSAHANNEIVFIDMNYVLSNSTQGKLILNELEKKNESNLSILDSREKLLKELENDINKQKNIISEEELKKKIDNLKNKITLFNKEKKKLVNEFNNLKNSEIAKLMEQINPLVSNYVKKNSINIVLDKKNVIIGKKNYDITFEILELVNANIK